VRRPITAALASVCLLLLAPSAARASDFGDDLHARRARLMERLGADAMLVLWSAPTARYSLDIDYEYRQDSNLYYLTGLTQDATILVLMPGNTSRREILFVRDRDPVQEHWRGRTLGADDARARTGIETVETTSRFDTFVAAILSGRGWGAITAEEASRFFGALSAGHAHVALALESGRGMADPPSLPLQFARKIRERFVGFDTIDAMPALEDLRTVKTPYERQVLVKSLEISNEAQLAGMRATRPNAYEYEVKAAIEAVHRGRGAVSWSYPSIVGSGPNATILHYPDGDRQMLAGELLLVDAACNYGYMAGDITRTYPVSGTFSSLQKDVYGLVLQAQQEGIRAARPGASLQDIHAATVDVIKAGLLRLGLISTGTGIRTAPRTTSASTCTTWGTGHAGSSRAWRSPSSRASTSARASSTRCRARRRTWRSSSRSNPRCASTPTSASVSRIRFFWKKQGCATCRPRSPGRSMRSRRSFVIAGHRPTQGDRL
jgi:Xaa-Pro aminopeptidase